MKAAIYCRHSTEQTGGKKGTSVARQEQLARDFAQARNWTVHRDHVYVDDGISGAEFLKRPGLQAMLAAAKRSEFRVLVVSEQKSIGRESVETMSMLKRLKQAGIGVWSYAENRSLTFHNALEKQMANMRAFGDEAHREDTARRTYEGHTSKFGRGHVVGGRVFGYRNVDICSGTDEHGRPVRSYVEREIYPEQAATIGRIFTMFASGAGLKGIARALTAESIEGPKPFKRKDGSGLAPYGGWAPSTVRAILGREDYRGVYVWNRSKKRDDDGAVKQRPRPESEWKRIEKPLWRIVSDDLWNRVAERRKDVEAMSVRLAGGRLSGRPPKDRALNLLAGIAKCGVCGGGLTVETYFTKQGQPRSAHYVCNRRRASGACKNALRIPVADMEDAVLTAIEDIALTPEAVEGVILSMRHDVGEKVARSLEKELAEAEKRIARLANAIAAGGEMTSLVGKLRELEAKKSALVDELASQRPVPMPPRALVEDRLAEWRRLLRQNAQQSRVVLDRVLRDRITFTPEGRGYVFECPTRYDRLFSGLVVPTAVWALPAAEGAEGIGPDDVYYRGERDADFGEVLRRAAANRKGLASPTGTALLGLMANRRSSAGCCRWPRDAPTAFACPGQWLRGVDCVGQTKCAYAGHVFLCFYPQDRRPDAAPKRWTANAHRPAALARDRRHQSG